MLRLLIGFALLAVVVAAARESLPPMSRIYGHLFVMGAINIAIPFSLITWAEQTVDSSVAAILNGGGAAVRDDHRRASSCATSA